MSAADREHGNLSQHISLLGQNESSFSEHAAGTVENVLKIVSLAFIMVVGVVGNSFVIAVFCKNQNLKRTINYFIVNMAVSDLFIPVIAIPVQIVALVTGGEWQITGTPGEVLCKLSMFLVDTTPGVSILSMLFMSVDRFCAVVFPLKLLMSPRIRVFLIASSWFVAFGAFLSHFYAMTLVTAHGGQVFCALDWGPTFDPREALKVHAILIAVVFIMVPFALLVIIYSVIAFVITRRSETLASSKGNRRARRNKEAIKISLIVIATFALCWWPYNITLLLLSTTWNWRPPPNWETLSFVLKFLGYSNTAITPCIYFLYIQNYRAGLKRVFSRSPSLATSYFRSDKRSGWCAMELIPIRKKDGQPDVQPARGIEAHGIEVN